MQESVVQVELSSAGGKLSTAPGVLQHFSSADRAARAAGILLLGAAGAALLIPIPIIHLVGIPLLLLIGLITATRQLTLAGRLKPVRLPCPNCGALNRVGGGLGVARPDAPLEINCDSCRRGLTLRALQQDQ